MNDRPPEQKIDETIVQSATDRSLGAVSVRCPHCRNEVELLADASFHDIECFGCGSSFNLVSDDENETHATESIKSIGHLKLVERIGMGGFGTVWKAHDTKLERTVAVKIPRRGQLDSNQEEQFLREARVAAQLRHPNIVSVHEVGRDDGTLFIVNDLVRGVDLSDWLKTKSMAFPESAELCAKIGDALHYAHEQGIVHRDLKPGNIMLSADSEPHILDFGLAKRDVGEVTMTVDGQIMGTPAYMSPEQASGQGHDSDRRTDIYSLGVILFELLTGQLPFRGNTRMLIHQVINDEPPDPRKLDSQVPADLATICLKCMEKSPAQRYNTAQEVAEELKRFRAGEPILARPIGPLARTWRWCKRKPVIAGLSALSVLSLVAGTIVSLWFAMQSAQAEQIATQEHLQAEQSAIAATKSANEAARIASLAEAKAGTDRLRAYGSAGLGSQLGLLRLARSRDVAERLGDEGRAVSELLWNGWYKTIGERLVHVVGHDGIVSDVVFDDVGEHFATAGSDNVARVWSVASGEPVSAPLKHDGPVNRVRYSSSGDLATSSQDGTVRIWSRATNYQSRHVFKHLGPVLAMEFTRDGQGIVTGSDAGEALLWDLEDGTKVTLLNLDRKVHGVAHSPNGSRVAVLSTSLPETKGYNTSVHLLSLAEDTDSREIGEPVVFPKTFSNALAQLPTTQGISFHPDGNSIAITAANALIAIPVKDTLGKPRTLASDGNIYWGATYSHSGQFLATAGANNGAQLVEHQAKRSLFRSANISKLGGHVGDVYCVKFSPDDRVLVTASWDQSVKIWDVQGKTAHARGVPLQHFGKVWAADFSPCGKYLATASSDGSARVWDLSRSRGVRLAHTDAVTETLFDDSNSRLLTTCRDGTAKLWEVPSGKLVRQLPQFDAPILNAEWAHGRIALALDDKTIEAWQEDGTRLWSQTPPLDGSVFQLRFNRDASTLAVMTRKGTVILLDALSGEMIGQPVSSNIYSLSAIKSPLAFAADGMLAILNEYSVRIWKVEDDQLSLSATCQQTHHVRSVVSTPDGLGFVSISWDGTARAWDARTGNSLADAMEHPKGVSQIDVAPEGRLLFTGGDDPFIRIWDTNNWRKARNRVLQGNSCGGISASDDGMIFAAKSGAGTSQSVTVWHTDTSLPVFQHKGGLNIDKQRVSKDGSFLSAIVSNNTVLLTDLRVPKRGNREIALRTWLGLGAELVSAADTEQAIPWSRWQAMRKELREIAPDAMSNATVNDALWHERQIDLFQAKQDITAATWHASRLIEQGHDVARMLAKRAEVYQSAGNHEVAIADLSNALNRAGSAELLLARAKSYVRLEDYEPAAADYLQARRAAGLTDSQRKQIGQKLVQVAAMAAMEERELPPKYLAAAKELLTQEELELEQQAMELTLKFRGTKISSADMRLVMKELDEVAAPVKQRVVQIADELF